MEGLVLDEFDLVVRSVLRDFLHVLRRVGRRLFCLQAVRRRPLIFIFCLVVRCQVQVGVLRVDRRVAGPCVLGLEFQCTLRLTVILRGLRRTVTSPIGNLRYRRRVVVLRHVLLRPFA